MSLRDVNCSVSLPLHLAKSVFAGKVWYCPSEMFDEISDTRDRVRIIFFVALHEVDDERTEGQVLGYYFYPEHKGKAVFDGISRSFVHSETGSHEVISGEEGEVVRFTKYIKIPFLESKRGHRIWQFDDSDAIKILQAAQETHLRAEEDPQRVQSIVNSLQLVLADIEEKKDRVSPDLSQEYEALSPWLRGKVEECQVSGFPPTGGVVRKLIALAKERGNPDYYLQAAKLQIRGGDYKFVITLANYSSALAYRDLNEGRWDNAFERFLEAASLYQRDPMITETGWKRSQRIRILRFAVQAATNGVLDSNGYSLSEPMCLEAVEKKVAHRLKSQLPSHQIRQLICDSYYVEMAMYLLNTGRRSEFLQFFEEGSDQIEFPDWMKLRYYREKSRELTKKHHVGPEGFVQAAEYRRKAAELLKQSDGKESVGFREEMVDYHRCMALAHISRGEIADFDSHIDAAIQLAAELREDPDATVRQEENLHFLRGVKHGGLARHETDPGVAAQHHFEAAEAYGQVQSPVAAERSAFNRLKGYQLRVRSVLGKTPENFEEAASVCREAVSELWDKGGTDALRSPDMLSYRALFESICLLTTDCLSVDLWSRSSRFHERVQAGNVKQSARWIWNLAYGTRLIESSGVTLGEVVVHLRGAVRSAICQLLERETVSEDELYDDLVAIQLDHEQRDKKKRVLSMLRQRRLSAEGLEIECKEFLYNPSAVNPRIISSLHEAVIEFLNSPNGGLIIVGVEDDSFDVKGVDRDLQRFGGSEGELKDAIINHIRGKLQPGLPLPNITVSFEQIDGDRRVIIIDVPHGAYLVSLYRDIKGVAFIRMDGSKKTIRNALEQDELASQRRQSKGPWAPRSQVF